MSRQYVRCPTHNMNTFLCAKYHDDHEWDSHVDLDDLKYPDVCKSPMDVSTISVLSPSDSSSIESTAISDMMEEMSEMRKIIQRLSSRLNQVEETTNSNRKLLQREYVKQLISSIRYDEPRIFESYHLYGFNLNSAINETGNSLHYACKYGATKCIIKLYRMGVDFNIIDGKHRTFINILEDNSKQSCIEMLIKQGIIVKKEIKVIKGVKVIKS